MRMRKQEVLLYKVFEYLAYGEIYGYYLSSRWTGFEETSLAI